MTDAHPASSARTTTPGTDRRPGEGGRRIVSPAGTPLIEMDHRLAPALNDTMISHKLLAASDETIMPGDAVTPASLAQAIEELLTREPIFADLMPGSGERRQLSRIFAALPLSDRMIIKLTTVGGERPELLTHGLRAAFCAAALAQRLRMPHHEVAEAAAAGLFHDLGLLHVDPALLQVGRHLEEHERHYLDAHPLTGYLILEGETAWHPIVSTAVLEHHERVDGSGYPRGLGERQLGPLGQLLAVAELAASLLVPGSAAMSWLRLSVVLRMNEQKLNRDFVSCLLESFPHTAVPKTAHHDLGAAIEILVNLAIAFQGWKAVRVENPDPPLVAFVDKRLDRLGRNLADVGIDLEYWQELDADIEHDALALNEIKLAAREGLWQLFAIADETRRRWARLQPAPPAAVAWLENIEALPR